MAKKVKLEKRILSHPITQKVLCALMAGYIKLIGMTCRVRFAIPEETKAYLSGEKQCVLAFWHGRMLYMPLKKPKGRSMHVLISGHNDGVLISRVIKHFDIETVVGSSSKGSLAALRQIKQIIKLGGNIAITPDGPRGPRHVAAPGIVYIAQVADLPVIATTFGAKPAKHFHSWDKFCVPYPFSRIVWKVSTPIFPQGEGEEALEQFRQQVESALVEATDLADYEVGQVKGKGMLSGIYRGFSFAAAPFLPLLVCLREKQGKEDTARTKERFGDAGLARPLGKLLWIHAASMGETASVVPLIKRIHAEFPSLSILLTTVTLTSARFAGQALEGVAIHQFAPFDTPRAVEKFLAHWQPNMACWVESELWPNLIAATRKRNIPMTLLNARMSDRSFQRWIHARGFISELLASFDSVYAQSPEDAKRLTELGGKNVTMAGNLKFSAPPLDFDADKLVTLEAEIAGRPVWLAASTHAGEEKIAGNIHRQLKKKNTTLLSIIVPRHNVRGEEIRRELETDGLRVAQRSKGETVQPETDIYLADTMGEMGLFYRLSRIVFIGGSLVPHGGQNPLEPARLGCAILYGSHMHNFKEFCRLLEASNAALCINDEAMLKQKVGQLLDNPALLESMCAQSKQAVAGKEQILEDYVAALRPVLTGAVA